VFFENSGCLRCGTELCFDAAAGEIVALGDGRRCGNAAVAGCNWRAEDGEDLCRCCELTRTRPADDDADGLVAFARAERAKRRLVFQLLDLGLPMDGLAFDLMSSRTGPVVTGHDEGLITIDLAESDNAHRENLKAELGEPYRTLLGHFRHEIGHYYWPLLTAGVEEGFRALFGDERVSYEEAIERHYREGPPPDWPDAHVSAYATMHPWEDWAETFAHYLHIRDTLQTAAAFGMIVTGPPSISEPSLIAAPGAGTGTEGMTELVDEWLPLTYALNAVNRSMGDEDLYPFVLAPTVIAKLGFVHRAVQRAARHPRSNGSRHARGAIRERIESGPHESTG
jgi:hypothetical protein